MRQRYQNQVQNANLIVELVKTNSGHIKRCEFIKKRRLRQTPDRHVLIFWLVFKQKRNSTFNRILSSTRHLLY